VDSTGIWFPISHQVVPQTEAVSCTVSDVYIPSTDPKIAIFGYAYCV